jgi:hypothetical protein
MDQVPSKYFGRRWTIQFCSSTGTCQTIRSQTTGCGGRWQTSTLLVLLRRRRSWADMAWRMEEAWTVPVPAGGDSARQWHALCRCRAIPYIHRLSCRTPAARGAACAWTRIPPQAAKPFSNAAFDMTPAVVDVARPALRGTITLDADVVLRRGFSNPAHASTNNIVAYILSCGV